MLKRQFSDFEDRPVEDCATCAGQGHVVCTWCHGGLICSSQRPCFNNSLRKSDAGLCIDGVSCRTWRRHPCAYASCNVMHPYALVSPRRRVFVSCCDPFSAMSLATRYISFVLYRVTRWNNRATSMEMPPPPPPRRLAPILTGTLPRRQVTSEAYSTPSSLTAKNLPSNAPFAMKMGCSVVLIADRRTKGRTTLCASN